jgi:hypothetical protein
MRMVTHIIKGRAIILQLNYGIQYFRAHRAVIVMDEGIPVAAGFSLRLQSK